MTPFYIILKSSESFVFRNPPDEFYILATLLAKLCKYQNHQDLVHYLQTFSKL